MRSPFRLKWVVASLSAVLIALAGGYGALTIENSALKHWASTTWITQRAALHGDLYSITSDGQAGNNSLVVTDCDTLLKDVSTFSPPPRVLFSKDVSDWDALMESMKSFGYTCRSYFNSGTDPSGPNILRRELGLMSERFKVFANDV